MGGEIRRRVVVHGRVQGVFFRDSCRQRAGTLGVQGTVENLADGSVEVIAQGDRDAVDTLIEWCRSGPPRAAVTDIDVTNAEPSPVDGFRVIG